MKSREKHVAAASNYYNYSSSVNARETLLYLKSTGYFIYEPGYDLYRSAFDSFLLEVILDGKVMIETEGETFEATTGYVALVDCYKPHRYYSDVGWNALWAHFDGATAPGYYSWIRRTNGNVFRTRNMNTVQRGLQTIYNMFHSEGTPNEPQIAMELTRALTALMESAEPPKNPRNNTDMIDAVLYYINEQFDKELTVHHLAKIANFSEYHFIRIFRDIVGVTPRQYLITVRMDHAKYLLKSTALPVQEVGYSIGYASESMFCTAFKRYQGMTPTEYRNASAALPHGIPVSAEEEKNQKGGEMYAGRS